jgi:hypothetical protein
MAVGLPLKTTYADGDVYSASDVNDTNGTINAYLAPSLGYAAGKNKIINGDFFVNQRNFSSQIVSTSVPVYGADRWKCAADATSGTVTYSVQQFTAGTAPVSGYESKQYGRVVTTGQSNAGTYSILAQSVEDVRTLAGQTATISFWAKAASGTPKVAIEIEQYFGLGGSPSSAVRTYLNQVTISTSWARYSITASIPSISGKTFGTDGASSLTLNLWVSAGSTYNSFTGSIGIQSNTFDIWGVQVENGSTATAFQTATGSIQGELAACQRYYQFIGKTTSGFPIFQTLSNNSNQDFRVPITFPVQMRTSPTATKNGTWTASNCSQPSADFLSPIGFSLKITSTGAAVIFTYPDSTDDYIEFSAEL